MSIFLFYFKISRKKYILWISKKKDQFSAFLEGFASEKATRSMYIIFTILCYVIGGSFLSWDKYHQNMAPYKQRF